MAEDKKEPASLNPLMSLPAAASVVHGRVSGRNTNDPQTLNNMARLIASRTKIFTCESGQPAMLMPDELMEGHFDEGGAALRFNDPARAPIRELFIKTQDLGHLIDEIRAVYERAKEG